MEEFSSSYLAADQKKLSHIQKIKADVQNLIYCICILPFVYRSSTDRVEDLCSSGSRVSTQLQL